jgi:hypothetical protein
LPLPVEVKKVIIMLLIANLITCICAFIGFVYGIVKFFKPKKAVYAQMITLSVGCMAFGRLYQVVRLLTEGDITDSFQLGILGFIGSLLFLFSANFGAMDSLADDGSKKFIKYRIIPFAAPVVLVAVYLIFAFLLIIKGGAFIIGAVITFFAAQASYFNLKHLIFPDVDYGVIKCLKPYNLIALIYSLTCVLEIVFINSENGIAVLIIGLIMSGLLIAIVPSVERGMKKWTI